MTSTLTFCMYDDLHPCNNRVTVTFDKNNKLSLSDAVDKIVDPYLKGEITDASSYYFKDVRGNPKTFDKNEVLESLQKNGYYVLNRFEKFYVIAFAIDFVRFEIFSKDCEKQLIDWGSDNGKIVNVIDNENYNENPVVTLLRGFIRN